MECKLCGKDRDLRKSHILPELVFKAAYDEKHRAFGPDKDRKKVPYVQKGWRERLLCDSCETHLSRLELEFSQVWYESDLLPTYAPDKFLSLQVPNYSSFKLLHLSILWRASVATTRPFQQVRLGPYEDHMRQLILSGQPPAEAEYPIFGFVLRDPRDGGVEHSIVMPPTIGRLDGVRSYSAIFGGCAWYYIVSKQRPPLPESLMLRSNGMLTMPILDYTDHVDIKNFMQNWNRTQRRT